ncbi:phosphonate C-P lyase system protein PhnG [Allorhizobium pseudoryzae]|uniref:phosphonate C-P lyase system protein PhnG n=1 Tax=Allorhizobium pseudoryzae TaxID=379684 RepID=UPI003D05785E
MSDEMTGFISAGMPPHAHLLNTLARADDGLLKGFAEGVLPLLGEIEVVQSRTGLVMLPLRDTVAATDFHLGEVLVAEAHIRLKDRPIEGYGMVIGRDLERAMAMAVIDAAAMAGTDEERLGHFIATQATRIRAADEERLRAVEATRVEMETF